MEEVLYVFDPIKTALNTSLWTYLIVTVAIALLLYYFGKKKVAYEQRNMKQVLLMLGFFAFMILLGTTFFTWWTSIKIKPVTITATTIDTPYGTARLDRIRNAYIYRDQQKSAFNSEVVRGTTEFLMIEEVDKKTHALSEEYYDIKGILAALRKVLKVEEADKVDE